MLLGSHVKMAGKEMMLGSVKEALSYNATCFMIYTGAPQNTLRKPLSELRIPEAQALMKENNLELKNMIIHAPYIINPATSDLDRHEFAIRFLTEEVKRTWAMGSKIMVLHPGNFLDLDLEIAIKNISDVLNEVIKNTLDLDVVIALETMAGKGSEVGRTFEELNLIIEKINDKKRIGVCLDTCHIHDGGYDLVNDYDKVKNKFKEVIGLDYLKVVHVNDSKNTLGAHKDRHANIGDGFIGFETLHKFCHDKDLKMIPKILETPWTDGLPPYKEEISKLAN